MPGTVLSAFQILTQSSYHHVMEVHHPHAPPRWQDGRCSRGRVGGWAGLRALTCGSFFLLHICLLCILLSGERAKVPRIGEGTAPRVSRALAWASEIEADLNDTSESTSPSKRWELCPCASGQVTCTSRISVSPVSATGVCSLLWPSRSCCEEQARPWPRKYLEENKIGGRVIERACIGEIRGPDFSHYIFKDIGLPPVLKGMKKIIFLIKQNLILSRVKVYLAVKPGITASLVTRDLGAFYLVALPASTLWSKTAMPPPALVATFQSVGGWGKK